MSAYEQKMEPPDKRWQYLLFAAEPYETIAFKVRFLSSVLSFLPAFSYSLQLTERLVLFLMVNCFTSGNDTVLDGPIMQTD